MNKEQALAKIRELMPKVKWVESSHFNVRTHGLDTDDVHAYWSEGSTHLAITDGVTVEFYVQSHAYTV